MAAGSATAGPVTLQDLLAGGSITAGTLSFTSFKNYTQLSLQGTAAIDPSNIFVAPTAGQDGLVFTFTPAAVATSTNIDASAKYSFQYSVSDTSGGIVDAAALTFAGSVNAGPHSDAFVEVQEDLNDAAKTPLSVLLHYNLPGEDVASDSTTLNLGPLITEQPTVTFQLQTGAFGGEPTETQTAELDSFTQTFSSETVPEPATLLLLAIALSLPLGFRAAVTSARSR